MYHCVAVWRFFDKVFYSGAEPLIMELCLSQCALLVISEEVHSLAPRGLNSIFHVSISPCHQGVDVILEDVGISKGVKYVRIVGEECDEGFRR